VAEERSFWTTFRRPFMRNNIERPVFIDETNMVKASGWAPVGGRLIDHAPAGHRNTQTFIMALRHDGGHAPGITDGSMDMGTFDLYVERILAPALRRGDIVILDNLGRPPEREGRGNPGERRGPVPVPAEVQPGPQPDQDGLLEAEGADAEDRRANVRRPVEGRRGGLRPVHPAGMRELPRRSRI